MPNVDTIEGEIWKDILDWPFNQVSNMGRVRVLPGGNIQRRTIKEIELRTLTKQRNGYIAVSRGFSDAHGRYARWFAVHRLVLEAFHGPCPDGQECRHLNGDKTDNRWPENLKWGTYEENEQDKIIHGTDNRGERHYNTRFTESNIIDIRSRPDYWGVTYDLAREYKVSQSVIWKIRNRRTWKHIP